MRDAMRDILETQRTEYLLRSITTSLLAVGILALSAYQVIRTGTLGEPFNSWGGVILGFYFGAHTATNGRNLPRPGRRTDPDERV